VPHHEGQRGARHALGAEQRLALDLPGAVQGRGHAGHDVQAVARPGGPVELGLPDLGQQRALGQLDPWLVEGRLEQVAAELRHGLDDEHARQHGVIGK